LNAALRGVRSLSFAVDEETGDVAVTGLRSIDWLLDDLRVKIDWSLSESMQP
jgi:hypothetical protein